jgi:hypothetical protein
MSKKYNTADYLNKEEQQPMLYGIEVPLEIQQAYITNNLNEVYKKKRRDRIANKRKIKQKELMYEVD